MVYKFSDEHNANVVRIDRLYAPIVEIVSQFAIACLKKQVIFNLRVLHDFCEIKNVKFVLFSQN